MTDKEKIIKGLKQCGMDDEESCKECPYYGVADCLDVLLKEAAFTMLKECEGEDYAKDFDR